MINDNSFQASGMEPQLPKEESPSCEPVAGGPASGITAPLGEPETQSAGSAAPDQLPAGSPASSTPPTAAPSPAAKTVNLPSGRATIASTGISLTVNTAGGPQTVPLTNFGAEITREIIHDSAQGPVREYAVEVSIGGVKKTVTVGEREIEDPRVLMRKAGGPAVVFASKYSRELPNILRLTSSAQPMLVLHRTGWVDLEGQQVFAAGGGAIGETGVVPNVEVQLPPEAEKFELPAPPQGEARKNAIRSALQVLRLAPHRISYTLFAGIWRAALGKSDFSIWVVGPTGARKSELAAQVQQFFGRKLDARHLPLNWSCTENAMESLSNILADTVIVIDDFVRRGSHHDDIGLQSKAERILRGQGNCVGRMRCTTNGSLQQTRECRGLPVVTGEDVASGESLMGRTIVLGIQNSDVDLKELSVSQKLAAEGTYALAMAAFIRDLAVPGRREAALAEIERCKDEWRNKGAYSHPRAPDNLASLEGGMKQFLDFAHRCDAIDEAKHRELLHCLRAALQEVANAQLEDSECTDPTERFLCLIRSALQTGKAHVATLAGHAPTLPSAQAWGWEQSFQGGQASFCPQGTLVGWLSTDEKVAYLEINAVLAVVRANGDKSGESLLVTSKTLLKRLKGQGLIAQHDADRNTYKLTVNGSRVNTLAISADKLIDIDPAGPGPSGSPPDSDPDDGEKLPAELPSHAAAGAPATNNSALHSLGAASSAAGSIRKRVRRTSAIEWTHMTLNAIVGCSPVSTGCHNCYARVLHDKRHAIYLANNGRWSPNGRKMPLQYAQPFGVVQLIPERLAEPLSLKTPCRIFVNSLSDLYHKDVPEEFIQAHFEMMSKAPRHTFQVLTKRAARLLELSPRLDWLNNIWQGVSVESNQVFDRVDALRQTAAKVKWLSVEPLLGSVKGLNLDGIHWVVVGGESGGCARPMHPEWVRELRDNCLACGVPFFFKQWGNWAHESQMTPDNREKATKKPTHTWPDGTVSIEVGKEKAGRLLDGKLWDEYPTLSQKP